MWISQLTHEVECEVVGKDRNITGLTYDSRLIKPGDLFFAIRGYRFDGHKYIDDAIEKGASAVVVEKIQQCISGVTQILVNDSRCAMGELAAAYYDYPARKIRIIAITGTNGKTTTTYLLKSILEQAGYKVGLIGTIQNLIEENIIPAQRTTPESLDLQKLLNQMVARKIHYAVMEVSSHALELSRTAGLEFDTAIYTNLTQDHLDFHENIEQYFAAKAKLFSGLAHNTTKSTKTAIINYDDKFGLRMASKSSAPVYSYGIDQHAQVHARDLEVSGKGVRYRLVTPFGAVRLSLNLTGKFNVYNSMAASAAALAEGIKLSSIKAGLEQIGGVSGRFELIDQGQDFALIIDYAHSPDSLTNVLQTARSLSTNRVISVFGAGGDRDKDKRPLMGKAAAEYSDLIILTSDNPRSENPTSICHDIERGIEATNKNIHYEIEISRSKAISRALQLARSGDVVVVAGKGHETYQEFADRTIEFDDRLEALRALKELQKS